MGHVDPRFHLRGSGEEGGKFFLSLFPHPPPPLTEGGGQEKGGLEGRPPNAIGRDICTTPSLSPLPHSTQCKCLHKHFLFSSPLGQSFKRAVSEWRSVDGKGEEREIEIEGPPNHPSPLFHPVGGKNEKGGGETRKGSCTLHRWKKPFFAPLHADVNATFLFQLPPRLSPDCRLHFWEFLGMRN